VCFDLRAPMGSDLRPERAPPARPGNRLADSLRNILANPHGFY
jgi:hypothetical protein